MQICSLRGYFPGMDAKPSPTGVQVFRTYRGASIYQLPLEEFPGMWGFATLVLAEGSAGEPYRVLIDTGSGSG